MYGIKPKGGAVAKCYIGIYKECPTGFSIGHCIKDEINISTTSTDCIFASSGMVAIWLATILLVALIYTHETQRLADEILTSVKSIFLQWHDKSSNRH